MHGILPLTLKKLCCLALIALFLLSCGGLNGVTRKQLVFTTGDKQELRLNLPAGKAEENFRTDMTGGMEQFCAYPDGSVIYVARHISWPTPNTKRVNEQAVILNERADNFNGKDAKGLYWKEVYIEEFVVGYNAVPASRVEAFNQAISSVRIR